jgi:succinyl-CoA synthetase beta subunit
MDSLSGAIRVVKGILDGIADEVGDDEGATPHKDVGSEWETSGQILAPEIIDPILERFKNWMPPERKVSDHEGSVAAAKELGYPLVIKATDIPVAHRGVAGLVEVGVRTEEELRRAVETIGQRVAALGESPSLSFTIQTDVGRGLELLAGIRVDSAFGSVIVAGVGGVLTEVYDSVIIREPPDTLEEATAIAVEALRLASANEQLMKGSAAPAFAQVLLTLANVFKDVDGVVDDIVFNPVILHEDSCTIVDAKIYRTA